MEIKRILDAILDDRLKSLNVLVFGQIVKYDNSVGKVEIQPLHIVEVNGEPLQMPILVDIPVLHIGSKDFIINVPLAVGDIIPCMFADYDIENLVLSGEMKTPNTEDFHSLNDGVALPVVLNPFNNTLPQNNIDDLSIQKRNGNCKIVIPSGTDEVIVDAPVIKLGSGATKAVKLADDTSATKVFAE